MVENALNYAKNVNKEECIYDKIHYNKINHAQKLELCRVQDLDKI